MNSNKLINFKLKLLQNKTQQFSRENIHKLNSHSDLIFALKKKYQILFNIIDNHGIQYKQFLSVFFLCILMRCSEPFLIEIESFKDNKNLNYIDKLYNINSANYNYITLLPWSKYNIVKCNKYNKDNNYLDKIKIDKEQFLQCIIVLFPKFIKNFPKLFFELSKKLEKIDKNTLNMIYLYKYLIYCGDKLAKEEYNNKIIKNNNRFSKNKIELFLKIFTYEQLKQILV